MSAGFAVAVAERVAMPKTMYPHSVVRAFTEGDCWVLALAIEKMTGYPIHFLGLSKDIDETWVHAVNLLPDGTYLDIRGIQSFDEVVSLFSYSLDDRRTDMHRWRKAKAVITTADNLSEALKFQEKMFGEEFPAEVWAQRLLNDMNIAWSEIDVEESILVSVESSSE